MTLQFERKYSTQGLGAPCHVSFGFFSGFYGMILAELQIDPQLESTIRPKAWGLHSIWNAILQIAFSIWFLLQHRASTIEDLQEKNSRAELLKKTSRLLTYQLEYLPALGCFKYS
jgi:hypothetical protein